MRPLLRLRAIHPLLEGNHVSAPRQAARDDFALDLDAIADRRDWHRQRVKDAAATVSWKQDDGPHSQDCEAVDIGGGGIAILMSSVPPRGRVLSLRLQSLERVSVDGRMVDVQFNRKPGRHLVRIRFIIECPPSLFERAIHGSGSSPAVPRG